VPENAGNYYPGSPFGQHLLSGGHEKFNIPETKVHTCRIPQDNGGAWHVQRVVGKDFDL
jgi:hypothetical protein